MKPVLEIFASVFASVLVVSAYGADVAIAQRPKPPQKVQVQQQIVIPSNENADQLLERGNSYVRLGNLEGAIAQLRNALQFRSDYAAAFYTLGVAQARLGQRQEAIQSFIQAQAYFNQQKNSLWAQQSDRQIKQLR